jgi:hypothetical protein
MSEDESATEFELSAPLRDALETISDHLMQGNKTPRQTSQQQKEENDEEQQQKSNHKNQPFRKARAARAFHTMQLHADKVLFFFIYFILKIILFCYVIYIF